MPGGLATKPGGLAGLCVGLRQRMAAFRAGDDDAERDVGAETAAAPGPKSFSLAPSRLE